MSSRWLTCSALALAIAGSASAADPYPDHRWSLRGNFGINTPTDPLPGDGFLAVSLSRRVWSRLGVEAFFGPGLPVTTLAKDGSGGQREVDLGSGWHGAALLRLDHKLRPSGRALVSFAAGPSLVSGDVYGTVWMTRAEGGFDWRFAKGAAVVSLSIGYEWALTTSPSPIEASDCLHSGCPPYYKAGTGQVSARWGLGFTF